MAKMHLHMLARKHRAGPIPALHPELISPDNTVNPLQHTAMKRLRKWAFAVLAGFILLTVVPVLVLRWLPVPTSAVMLQRMLNEREWQHYQWTGLEHIAADVALAVVAAEDQKFPEHYGFDLQAIRKALSHNARGGQLRGASTLTQQVARNLFLWQGRSWIRKGLEAWMTVLIETLWSKQRILEVYLNIAETGRQTFGVEAAAQRFLATSAARITRRQAALIAAVLPSPNRLHIAHPSPYVLERRDHILQQMEALGGTDYLRNILPVPAR
jgi:monofunctional biosynthetic peptidoglycan transglycosylase